MYSFGGQVCSCYQTRLIIYDHFLSLSCTTFFFRCSSWRHGLNVVFRCLLSIVQFLICSIPLTHVHFLCVWLVVAFPPFVDSNTHTHTHTIHTFKGRIPPFSPMNCKSSSLHCKLQEQVFSWKLLKPIGRTTIKSRKRLKERHTKRGKEHRPLFAWLACMVLYSIFNSASFAFHLDQSQFYQCQSFPSIALWPIQLTLVTESKQTLKWTNIS